MKEDRKGYKHLRDSVQKINCLKWFKIDINLTWKWSTSDWRGDRQLHTPRFRGNPGSEMLRNFYHNVSRSKCIWERVLHTLTATCEGTRYPEFWSKETKLIKVLPNEVSLTMIECNLLHLSIRFANFCNIMELQIWLLICRKVRQIIIISYKNIYKLSIMLITKGKSDKKITLKTGLSNKNRPK